MFWYVLFVKTGYEEQVVEEITKGWDIDGLRPFAPKFDAHFRKAGNVLNEKRYLFPGYIFVETELKGNAFYAATRSYIESSAYILKVLRYGSGYESQFEMSEMESYSLNQLYNHEYCVEMSRGFIIGDAVKVTSGPLIGFESRIRKINRHRMEAVIEIGIMGCLRNVTVGLEVVERRR